MSSTLFSTICSIQSKSYELHIRVKDDSSEYSSCKIKDILSKISTDDNAVLDSIQLEFEPLFDTKTTHVDIVPKSVLFNKFLSIKPTEQSSNALNVSSLSQRLENWKSSSSTSTEVVLSYVEITESYLWKVEKLSMEIDSTIADQLDGIFKEYLSKLAHRPRHLLVFVNPQCGKNQGSVVYEEEILPLFEQSNIHVTTIYTERARHAYDYISEESLDDYDGLICVGGDGMFSELCHSLLLRTGKEAGLDINNPDVLLQRPRLRLGVIPAGSTDAVVYGTTGHHDPVTSALQIILGTSLLIDIATVHNERQFLRFLGTMLAYGFFGNVIRQSDRWRIFGPFRYSLAGLSQFLRNRSYLTEVILSEENQSKNSSSCTEIRREDRYKTINCLNMPCRCEKSKYGMSPTVHLGDGSFDLILVKRSWRVDFLRFLLRVARRGHTIEQLPNVERFRVNEVLIRPIVTEENERGHWACDGEFFQADQVRIRAHRQVLNLFAAGIRPEQVEKINEENSKSFIEEFPWIYFLLLLLLIFVWFYYFFPIAQQMLQ